MIPAIVILMWRHRGRPIDDDPPTFPAVATWGAIGRPVDPDAIDDDFDDDEGYDNLFADEVETRPTRSRRPTTGRGADDDAADRDRPDDAPDDADEPTEPAPG